MSTHVQRPQFLPDGSLTRDEMEQLQREIAKTAVFEDDFVFDRSLEDVTVAGVDQAFIGDNAVSGIVVMENGDVVEKVYALTDTVIPYIPGLLAFREGAAILAAFEQLSTEPDLMVVDGSGRIHFREAGIATHIGVITDIPSVGVAKNLLCGEYEHPLEENMARGTRVPVLAGDSIETVDDPQTVIGYAFQSKQYSGKQTVNPLIVSSGHRISGETAVDFVEQLTAGYKLPEPTRLADQYVADIKDRLQDRDQQDLSEF